MIAIETKYLGPTNCKVSRISVSTCNGHRMIVSYPYELNMDDAHKYAAECLQKKMQWKGKLIGGGTKKGMCFVFAE